MPYDIAKDFDGCAYAVVKLTTDGKELAPGGCHENSVEAGKHLAALEAATDYERAEPRADGHQPTGAMKAEARRGLEWRQEFGRGGTEVGVARARDIVNGRNLSLDTLRRMVSYFARHEVDKEGEGWSQGEPGYPSAGRIAWALWGGNPGRTWANSIYSRESRVLPDNFRPALAQDVPEGRACGNCSFYNEEKVQGDKAWCEKWDAYVSGAYYCNAWQPHGDGEAHDEPYDEMDDDEDRADPPAPPSDQIKGSNTNEPDSAKGKTGKIVLSPETVVALQNKSDEHNAAMAESDRPSWTRVRLGSLKAVYRRGSGAFSGSHRPGIGRAQWSMARVNAFLVLARTGKPKNPKYVGDNDLLNSDHPRYSEKKAAPSRSLDFNYELRHPAGGHDQSAHNPRKGGGWTPGGLKLQPKKTKAEFKAEILANDPAKLTTRADRLAGFAVARNKNIDTYKNGDVTIEVSKQNKFGRAVAPIDPKELEVIDKTAGAIVSKYPGELTVKYHAIDEPGVFGKAEIGARTFVISPLAQSSAPMKVSGHDAGNLLEYTMWHEAGHAIQMKGQKAGFQYQSESLGLIAAAQGKVASRLPNVGVGFQPGKQSIELSLTSYAGENAFEWHAEAFAIHNLKVPVGAFTKSIVSEYAKEMDWSD